jgi:general transcriptional corepressor TUP1
MTAFQQAIYDLDRIHNQIKKQYEDEIMRLRSELESRGIPLPPTGNLVDRQYRKPNGVPEGIPPPNLASNRSHAMGAFGTLMQGHHPYTDKDPNAPQKRLKGPDGAPQQPPARQQQPPVPLKPVHAQRQQYPSGYPPQPQRSLTPPQPQQLQHVQQSQQSQLSQPPLQQQQYPPQVESVKVEELQLVLHPKLRKSGLHVDLVHCFDHTSVVCCVKFSPDGKYLATGCNHLAQIFEIASGRKIL